MEIGQPCTEQAGRDNGPIIYPAHLRKCGELQDLATVVAHRVWRRVALGHKVLHIRVKLLLHLIPCYNLTRAPHTVHSAVSLAANTIRPLHCGHGWGIGRFQDVQSQAG